jgi:hypothetical protein
LDQKPKRVILAFWKIEEQGWKFSEVEEAEAFEENFLVERKMGSRFLLKDLQGSVSDNLLPLALCACSLLPICDSMALAPRERDSRSNLANRIALTLP